MKKVYGSIRTAIIVGLLFIYLLSETVLNDFKVGRFFYSDWLIVFILGALSFYLIFRALDVKWAYGESGFQLLKGPNKGKYVWSDVEKVGIDTVKGRRFFLTKNGTYVYLSSLSTASYSRVIGDVIRLVEKNNQKASVFFEVSEPTPDINKKELKTAESYLKIFVFTLGADAFEVFLCNLPSPALFGNWFPLVFAPFPIVLFFYHLGYLIINLRPKNSDQRKILLMSLVCLFAFFLSFGIGYSLFCERR